MAGGFAGSIVRFRSDLPQLYRRQFFDLDHNRRSGFQASNSDHFGRPAAVADRHYDSLDYAEKKDANAYLDASTRGDRHECTLFGTDRRSGSVRRDRQIHQAQGQENRIRRSDDRAAHVLDLAR
jgi:hypothetical protein